MRIKKLSAYPVRTGKAGEVEKVKVCFKCERMAADLRTAEVEAPCAGCMARHEADGKERRRHVAGGRAERVYHLCRRVRRRGERREEVSGKVELHTTAVLPLASAECGRHGPLEIHHLTPRSRGRNDRIEKLRALCASGTGCDAHRRAHGRS